MTHRLGLITFVTVCATWAASKGPAAAHAENAQVRIEATLYTDKESIKQLLGNDLGGFYVVVQLHMTPKAKITIDRQDFQLRSDRDGEKSKPYAPSQIAGRSVLVVSQTADGGGAVMGEQRGPAWGGIGGPPMMGPANSGGVGNAGTQLSNEARVDDGKKKKENPLLSILGEKVLAEKEADQPVAGMLFFPMEPKQKPKDLELTYSPPGNRITMRFR